MKGCGLDVLVSAAFGGLTGIMNAKEWVRAMRAFRMVTAALLQCLQNGEKTFNEISEYVEGVRHHPTGRNWVDNLVKPTLLVHQFLRAESEGDWLFQQLCLERMLSYFFTRRSCSLRSVYQLEPARDAPLVASRGASRSHRWSECMPPRGRLLEFGIHWPVWRKNCYQDGKGWYEGPDALIWVGHWMDWFIPGLSVISLTLWNSCTLMKCIAHHHLASIRRKVIREESWIMTIGRGLPQS